MISFTCKHCKYCAGMPGCTEMLVLKCCTWSSSEEELFMVIYLSLLFPLMTYNCFDKDSEACEPWPYAGVVTRISFPLMQCRVLTGVQLCGWWQLWLASPFMLSWVLTAFKVAKRRWQPRPTRGSVTSPWNLGRGMFQQARSMLMS